MDLDKPRRRLDPVILDQYGTRELERGQRLGLPARAVQRGHQLAPQHLPGGMGPHQPFEFDGHLGVEAHDQRGLDPCLDRRHPGPLQPGRLRRDRRMAVELGEGIATPQAERGRQPLNGELRLLRRQRLPARRRQPFEPHGVDHRRIHPQLIARRPGYQQPLRTGGAAQSGAQPRHIGAYGPVRVRGRKRTPQFGRQRPHAHGPTGHDRQPGENAPQLRTTKIHGPAVDDGLQRSEHT